MNAGVVAVGAVKRSGALEGSTDRSYVGETDGEVQMTSVSLLGREHEPSAPKKTLGPSTDEDEELDWVSEVDGDTVSSAT